MSTLQKIKNIFHPYESLFGAVFFVFPARNLTVVGVTGTDGKTTTTNLIGHILKTAGIKTGVSSTLDSPHTSTPGRWHLQRFLKKLVNDRCTHAVLEITSIGADQGRQSGIKFTVGVLTNIANNEHLDYHQTFNHYLNSKFKFLSGCQKIVLNADDSSAELFIKKYPKLKSDVSTYSLKDWESSGLKTSLLGDFNKLNILAACQAAKLLGVKEETIKKALSSFLPLSGRLETVIDRPFQVIVDFAHTPQAFENVLPTVKPAKSRLIHVFGCTGDRDKGKRPLMGAIAEKFDDVIILTHEDTYFENLSTIIEQIKTGIKNKSPIVLLDRHEAIKKALSLAKPGDVVIITGVGHQKSLNMGGIEVPWSDQDTVRELMKK